MRLSVILKTGDLNRSYLGERMVIMVHKIKFFAAQLFGGSNSRAILFLIVLLIAMLAGGAPSDHMGG